MDESYRIDGPGNMYPVDLDSTWSGGDAGQLVKGKPPSLSTARLKPFRQVTKGAILSILETGHVSMELLKKRGDQQRVVELFVITGDGQEICVEQWKPEGSSVARDSSVLSGDLDKTWKTFTYSALPEKYWKKYAHAYRFVDLVKSKTAKVTMYSEKAKGVLMENCPPSFETAFFLGPKIVICGNEIHLREESGACLLLHRDSLNHLVNDYTLDLIQHAAQMREQCLRLEASVMSVQAMSYNSEHLFPVTVGIRPSSSFCSSVSSNSGSIDLLSSPRFSHLHSSPSSGSQGHSASPPPSPGPQVDLRCLESPIRHTPTSHPSPIDCKAPQSPLRHISTLEGRKFRRQLSDSSDSSYTHHINHPSIATPSLDHSMKEQERSPEILPAALRTPKENAPNQQQLFIVPPSPVTSSTPQRGPLFNSVPQEYNRDGQASDMCFQGVEQTRQLTHESLATGYGREMTAGGDMAEYSFRSNSLPMSNSSTPKKAASALDKNSSAGEEASTVIRQTFVPYTGWVSQHADGAIWIRYNEGTQLGVKSGHPEVVYVDQQGNNHRYLQSDNPHIPEVVRQKLEKIPMVIDSLKRQPVVSTHMLPST